MAGRDRNANDITVTTDYRVPVDMDYVYANATAGAIAVTLIRTKDKLLRRQVVVKIDSSANVVTVSDGTLSVELVTQDDAGVFEQKSNGQFFMSAANLAQITAGDVALEIPTGDVDGLNDEFVFVGTPKLVFRNGVLQSPDAYTVVGTTVTFDTAPADGEITGLTQ